MRGIDEAWGSATLSNIGLKLKKKPDKCPSVLDVIEVFRDNLRFTKANAKNPPAASFAAFQGDSPNKATPSKAPASASSTSSAATGTKKLPPCVCGDSHWFADCPYIHKSNRQSGWVANKGVQTNIDEKLAENSKLKNQIENSVSRKMAKQSSESQNEAQKISNPPKAAFAASAVFSVDRDSYELRDSWILDSGANSHVCNDPTRFNFGRKASETDTLISGKTVYQIEAFGSVEITVQSQKGPKQIDLLNVALIPGFFTNIAS